VILCRRWSHRPLVCAEMAFLCVRNALLSLVASVAAVLAACPVAIAAPSAAARQGPRLTVFVRSPDTPAEQMDATVAAPVAQALAAVPEVSQIETESSDGGCTTIVSFAPAADPDAAVHRVVEALAAMQGRLPPDVDPPQVRAGDARVLPTFWVVLQSDTLDLAAVSAIARTIVSPGLARIAGVGDVRIIGGSEPRPTLWLDAAKLAPNGLTPGDVAQVVAEQAGKETKAGPGIRVPDELSQVALRTGADGTVVRVRDVGRLEMAAASRGFATLDDRAAIFLGISASQRGGRVLADDIGRALAGLARELPAGVKATLALSLSPQSLLFKLNPPSGASPELLRRVVDQVNQALREKMTPAPVAVIAFSDATGDGAQMLVQLPANSIAATAAAQARAILSRSLPAETRARVSPVTFDAGGSPVTFPVHIALTGPDAAVLWLWASSTMARLPDSVIDAGTEPPNSGEPRLRFNVDRKECERFAVKQADVAETIALVQGRSKRVRLAGGQILEIRLEGDKQHEPPELHVPKMRNSTGYWLSLTNVTTVEQAFEPTKLLRLNGRPCLLLTAAPSTDTPLDTATNEWFEAANAALREMKHSEGCRAIRLDR
jgi:multidrug efflux pump subunit AcrB